MWTGAHVAAQQAKQHLQVRVLRLKGIVLLLQLTERLILLSVRSCHGLPQRVHLSLQRALLCSVRLDQVLSISLQPHKVIESLSSQCNAQFQRQPSTK